MVEEITTKKRKGGGEETVITKNKQVKEGSEMKEVDRILMANELVKKALAEILVSSGMSSEEAARVLHIKS